jgi:lipopolysaccharide/colanic/teichoic acid biosynthesis glycosyltransferase
MMICILISYVLASFKEMSWPIKFIKGARPGLKRPAQVTSDSATNTEKRFKYEKEKRPEQVFNAKWCEGRPLLNYDRDEMSWPIKFIKGARPGLKRPAQVTSDSATNTEKRFKYEKEKIHTNLHVFGIYISVIKM